MNMKYESVPGNDVDDLEGQTLKFESISPRIGFVRKVYSILLAQLAFTVIFCGICMGSPTMKGFMHSDIGLGFALVAAITTVIVSIALLCYSSVARKSPMNYYLLSAFTISEAYLVGFICMAYSTRIVFMAACMTLGMTLALTIYAFTTKKDFTMWGGALFIAGMALLMLGLFTMFTKNNFIHILYSCLTVVLYGFYLIYDTQLVMGGKRIELDMDDYIIGALILYIDIIELFINILKILGKEKE